MLTFFARTPSRSSEAKNGCASISSTSPVAPRRFALSLARSLQIRSWISLENEMLYLFWSGNTTFEFWIFISITLRLRL